MILPLLQIPLMVLLGILFTYYLVHISIRQVFHSKLIEVIKNDVSTRSDSKIKSKIRFIPCKDHYLEERYLIPDATKYDKETRKERRY